MRPELAAGVVHRLVDGAAGAPEALGDDVDRHLLEDDRGEDGALPRGEVLRDGALDRGPQLVALRLGLGLAGRGSASRPHRAASSVTGRPRQLSRRRAAETSRIANLNAQVVKRLAPR